MHGSGDPIALGVLKKLVPNQFAAYEQGLKEALS
jgi:hypothetical protein